MARGDLHGLSKDDLLKKFGAKVGKGDLIRLLEGAPTGRNVGEHLRWRHDDPTPTPPPAPDLAAPYSTQ